MLSAVSQECISHSALVTKFAHHVANAGVIVSEVLKLWNAIHATSQTLRSTYLLTPADSWNSTSFVSFCKICDYSRHHFVLILVNFSYLLSREAVVLKAAVQL